MNPLNDNQKHSLANTLSTIKQSCNHAWNTMNSDNLMRAVTCVGNTFAATTQKIALIFLLLPVGFFNLGKVIVNLGNRNITAEKADESATVKKLTHIERIFKAIMIPTALPLNYFEAVVFNTGVECTDNDKRLYLESFFSNTTSNYNLSLKIKTALTDCFNEEFLKQPEISITDLLKKLDPKNKVSSKEQLQIDSKKGVLVPKASENLKQILYIANEVAENKIAQGTYGDAIIEEGDLETAQQVLGVIGIDDFKTETKTETYDLLRSNRESIKTAQVILNKYPKETDENKRIIFNFVNPLNATFTEAAKIVLINTYLEAQDSNRTDISNQNLEAQLHLSDPGKDLSRFPESGTPRNSISNFIQTRGSPPTTPTASTELKKLIKEAETLAKKQPIDVSHLEEALKKTKFITSPPPVLPNTQQ